MTHFHFFFHVDLIKDFLMFFYEFLPLKWLQICIKKSSKNRHFLILVRRVPFWGPPCSFWIPFGLHLSSVGLHFGDLGTLWAQFWQLWPPYGCILLVWSRICPDFDSPDRMLALFSPLCILFNIVPDKTPHLTTV